MINTQTLLVSSIVLQNMIHVALAVIVACVMTLFAKVFFKGIQQRGYQTLGFLNYLHKSQNKFVSRLLTLSIFAGVAYVVFCSIFAVFMPSICAQLGLVFFAVFCFIFEKNSSIEKTSARQIAQYTARLTRLAFVYFVVVFALSYFAIDWSAKMLGTSSNDIVLSCVYLPVCLLPVLSPYLLLFSSWLILPFENWNIARYGKIATKILEKHQIKVIAVAGSFGKTSTKDMIAGILSEKYNTICSPKSFNTPSGVALTVQNLARETTEFAVIEMGARRPGEIAHLCKIARPDYSVVTSVGMQHLESFKNYDNILSTKFEVVECIKEGGISFFNSQDDGARRLYNRCQTAKKQTGSEEHKFAKSFDATFEIKGATKDGSQFSVVLDGEEVDFQTSLLGSHSVSNLALAILVCHTLGVEIPLLQSGVLKLEQIPHRLELVKNAGCVVIDDSYNANIEGAKAAVEVLQMFSGRKILITPGLCELGDAEEEQNTLFGEIFAPACDKVILVGENRSKNIKDGLLKGGMAPENILIFSEFEDAKNSLEALAKPSDIVLFENDLPDSYL